MQDNTTQQAEVSGAESAEIMRLLQANLQQQPQQLQALSTSFNGDASGLQAGVQQPESTTGAVNWLSAASKSLQTLLGTALSQPAEPSNPDAPGDSNDDGEDNPAKKRRVGLPSAEIDEQLQQQLQQQLIAATAVTAQESGAAASAPGAALASVQELVAGLPGSLSSLTALKPGAVGLHLLAAAAETIGGDYASLLAAQERGVDIGPAATAAMAAHRQILLQQLLQQHNILQQQPGALGAADQGTALQQQDAGEVQVPPPAPLLPGLPEPGNLLEPQQQAGAAPSVGEGEDDQGGPEAKALKAHLNQTMLEQQQREMLLQQLAAAVPPGMDMSYLHALISSADPAAAAQAMQQQEEGGQPQPTLDASGQEAAAAAAEAAAAQSVADLQNLDATHAALAAIAAAGLLPGGLQGLHQQLMGLQYSTESVQAEDADTEDDGTDEGSGAAQAQAQAELLAALQSTLGLPEGAAMVAAAAAAVANDASLGKGSKRKSKSAGYFKDQDPASTARAIAAAAAAAAAGNYAGPSNASPGMTPQLYTDPAAGGAGTADQRGARGGGQSRRFHEQTLKVQFEGEGMRLADGRIYVPLPFIHKNFFEAQWPVQIHADIYVNGECIKEALQVKIARSQNKTRRHGLGNHWVTGHQRFIKNYKDVRLQGLEIDPETSRLKVMLSASGTWDEAAPQAAAGGAAGQPAMMPGMNSQFNSSVAQLLQHMSPGAFSPDLAALLAFNSSQPAPGLPQQQQQQNQLAAAAAAAFGGMAGMDAASLAAAFATAVGQGPPQQYPQQPGAATAPVSPSSQEGRRSEGGAPDGAAAAAAGAGEQAQAAAASAQGSLDIAAAFAAMDQAMNAVQQQQPQQQQQQPTDPQKQPGQAQDAMQGTSYVGEQTEQQQQQAAMDAATAGINQLLQNGGLTQEGLALMQGGQQSLQGLLQGMPQGQPAGAVPAGLMMGLPDLGGAHGMQDLNMAAAAQAGGLDLLAMLQRAAAGGQPDIMNSLLMSLGMGGAGLGGVPGMGAMGQLGYGNRPNQGHAAPNTSSQYPRLYDGRIHVPLQLIQEHFKDCVFPLPISTIIIINQQCIAEGVQARIVQYKKHKRPNHFNFWITGLQKTLARYNDVRQAGVAWESENCLRVNLVAAT